MRKISFRTFVELKGGVFIYTKEVLADPDLWKDLTPAGKKMIKHYAALMVEHNVDPEKLWPEPQYVSNYREFQRKKTSQ
jgi:hypothetical protein